MGECYPDMDEGIQLGLMGLSFVSSVVKLPPPIKPYAQLITGPSLRAHALSTYMPYAKKYFLKEKRSHEGKARDPGVRKGSGKVPGRLVSSSPSSRPLSSPPRRRKPDPVNLLGSLLFEGIKQLEKH